MGTTWYTPGNANGSSGGREMAEVPGPRGSWQSNAGIRKLTSHEADGGELAGGPEGDRTSGVPTQRWIAELINLKLDQSR